ncbi:MAG: outer membrane lipoprotein-sorting protein [Acidobacteriota bacterium]|nr:outer membrane lipoprotein-sorting protein [Acidobacteriota bacterium]
MVLTALLMLLLAAEPGGLEIMNKQKELQELRDEDRVIEMQLIDRRGKMKKRKVHMWNMKTEDGLEKLMLIFLEPRDVKGTGLLTWEQKTRDDDQWLYLPSLKKEKRIASGGKKNRFMGTDFAFEDLRVENLEKHTYNLLETKSLDGKECWLIEAKLKEKKELRTSGYSRRVLWIRKDIYYTAQIDYYDRRKKLVKVLRNEDPVKLEGTVWRSNNFVMENLKTKGKTAMVVKERRVNQGQSETDFTIRKLKSF